MSSKRTLLSGSLLLLILFYYVALPDPQAGSLESRTAFQAESAFRKNKKGSALADDTEIMMPLPIREDGPVKTLPWLNSFVERVKVRFFFLFCDDDDTTRMFYHFAKHKNRRDLTPPNCKMLSCTKRSNDFFYFFLFYVHSWIDGCL